MGGRLLQKDDVEGGMGVVDGKGFEKLILCV